MARRNLTRRRPQVTRQPPRHLDMLGPMGDEVTLHAKFREGKRSVGQLFDWYAYFYGHGARAEREEARGWVVEYMKSAGYSKEDVEAVRAASLGMIPSTIFTLCRCTNCGIEMPADMMERLKGRIAKVIEAEASDDTEETEDGQLVVHARPSVRDNVMGSVAALILKFDLAYESCLSDRQGDDGREHAVKPYEVYQAADAKPMVIQLVLEKFKPRLAELEELIADRPSDLREAYSHMSRADINRCADFLRAIVADGERYASNVKASRPTKGRRVKERSAAQLVRNLHYLREFPELKIVSVDPTLVVGARELWSYNVKYKRLTHLVTAGQHLSVRGSTVVGYDPERSQSKALRKPEKVLGKLLAPRVSPDIFKELTTKSLPPNGRVNRDTVLLRAVR